MNEKILKLIETYKTRVTRLTDRIAELKNESAIKNEIEIKLAQNARVFWNVVIKDLEDLVRKDN